MQKATVFQFNGHIKIKPLGHSQIFAKKLSLWKALLKGNQMFNSELFQHRAYS